MSMASGSQLSPHGSQSIASTSSTSSMDEKGSDGTGLGPLVAGAGEGEGKRGGTEEEKEEPGSKLVVVEDWRSELVDESEEER